MHLVQNGHGRGPHHHLARRFPVLLETGQETDLVFLLQVSFGHYKSAAHSNFLSACHAAKLSIISKTGYSPERWTRGLNVMLEKIVGIALVAKLRVVLLIEADFSFHNKLIIGQRI